MMVLYTRMMMWEMLYQRVSTDTWSYLYDAKNQLVKVEKNQKMCTEYSYDGNGRRVSKTEWVEDLQEYQTVIYVYSGLKVIYEKNLDTSKEATYVYGLTGRIAKNVDGLRDYYHTDHLGSTRLIIDEQGNVVSAVQYKAFGESDEESSLYTGKEKDASGLYYYGARYYDPDTGRFISRDPRFGKLQNPQTLNRYVYYLNNPLKYKGPDGRDPIHYDGPIHYEEDEKVLVYSHVPQLMVYSDCKEGYEWFAYYCILGGIILSIAAAPNLLPLLGGYFVSLAKALAAAGPKVASVVINVFSKVAGWVRTHLSQLGGWVWAHKKVFWILYGVVKLFQDALDWFFDIEDTDVDLFEWGLVLTIIFDDDIQWGYVLNLEGDSYRWRCDKEGNYYVLINGEWVLMPKGWEPGNELPGDLT